ncbi:unnamed protein product [Chironomus riparius]|uniref:Uncharacterized protein n=1 Tax=Chironomus riparius TaxID=315576 RepID=A0A9N9S0J2_9DIPT|nr:unnamed protein product [Chironomus riparius]
MESYVIVIIIAVVFVSLILLTFCCLAIIQRRNRNVNQSVEEGTVYPKYNLSTIQQPNMMSRQQQTMNPIYPVQFSQTMNTQNTQMPCPSLINPYRAPVTIISQCPPNQPCRQNQNAFIPAQPMQLPVYTQNVHLPMQYPSNNPQPLQNYSNVQQPMMPLQYNQPTNYYNMNRN